jgi:hypothetical protein
MNFLEKVKQRSFMLNDAPQPGFAQDQVDALAALFDLPQSRARKLSQNAL